MQKVPRALFETTKSIKKYDKRLLDTTIVACWQFTVGSGLRLIEVFGSHWMGGGDLVLFSSDKLQGELEEKQAVNSEEQCGIELCSADRPNPSAAGMSCGTQLHEWSRLCEIH